MTLGAKKLIIWQVSVDYLFSVYTMFWCYLRAYCNAIIMKSVPKLGVGKAE